ncbi:type II secretion system F family protein [Leifsonia sp. F6_8S_P_1B]|uniref:Type II secretion system F family protein n=1 Tax=Leifsonia williamsii TaxID=3035919 RepID=A0ABT8KIF6_9MICO|nr:type II secretion system F family protein [Leifsonia williamsii]MDN4616247.1 type II secretion system F family protein [Leifsonia williamsii]
MPVTTPYAYKGRDAAGKIVKGRVDASSEAAVASRLRTMGLSPVSITEAAEGTGLNREIRLSTGSGVKLKELAVMSRQMATMISSGLSLLRTLNIIAEQNGNKKFQAVLADVRDQVESGVAVSDAMRRHAQVFPPLMVNMVRAGETGGFLDGALEAVAENFEKEVKLRSAIKSAMTYPVIVLCMTVIGVAAMLLFVVPIFEKMFTGLGKELPLPTMILVHLSHAMVFVVPVVAVLGIVFALWWPRHKNDEAVRRRLDPFKLRMPIFGSLLKRIAIARFSRNFSNMISAGVPILQALRIVGETSGNWVLQQALVEVAEGVRQGESIASPLSRQTVFPPMVTQMVAVGEDAGSLETMLDKIADFYEQEVEATTEQLTSLIEPVMIAFLGVVIGGMVVALYLPIFGIASAVGG